MFLSFAQDNYVRVAETAVKAAAKAKERISELAEQADNAEKWVHPKKGPCFKGTIFRECSHRSQICVSASTG